MFLYDRREFRWAFALTSTATNASAPLSSAVVGPSADPFTVETATVTMAAIDLAWANPPVVSKSAKLARPRN